MTAVTGPAPLSFEAARRSRKANLQAIDAYWEPVCEDIRREAREALAAVDRQFWTTVGINRLCADVAVTAGGVLTGYPMRVRLVAQRITHALAVRETARAAATRRHVSALAAAEEAWDVDRDAFDFDMGES